jgi:hypothetical protein
MATLTEAPVVSIEHCDLAFTLGRFEMTGASEGWELVINRRGNVDLIIYAVDPLAVMADRENFSHRDDVYVWDEMFLIWVKSDIPLHDSYPVRVKVELVTTSDWEA